MKKYSWGIGDIQKEASDSGLEPLTNDPDGADESNKESSNYSRKYNIRSADLSNSFIEGLDEEFNTEGEIGLFYDVVPDSEESYIEDDAHYECHKYHNEESDSNAEESEPENDWSNVWLPSITISIEDAQKM